MAELSGGCLKTREPLGAWVALSVEHLTSAHVMISWLMSLSPASDFVLTAQSLEPTSDSVSLSLSMPPLFVLPLPVSQKYINIKKKIKANKQKQRKLTGLAPKWLKVKEVHIMVINCVLSNMICLRWTAVGLNFYRCRRPELDKVNLIPHSEELTGLGLQNLHRLPTSSSVWHKDILLVFCYSF